MMQVYKSMYNVIICVKKDEKNIYLYSLILKSLKILKHFKMHKSLIIVNFRDMQAVDKKRLFAFKLSNSWITRQDLYILHFKEYCNITFQNIYQSILPPTGFRRPPNPCQHLISSGYVPTARYLYKIRNQIRKMMSAIIGHNRRGENQCPENTQTRLEQEGAGSRKSLH